MTAVTEGEGRKEGRKGEGRGLSEVSEKGRLPECTTAVGWFWV
jgi:hypothetical protein